MLLYLVLPVDSKVFGYAIVLSISNAHFVRQTIDSYTIGRQSSPELQIITATKEIIEAGYSTLTGDGILIVSEVSPRGDAV